MESVYFNNLSRTKQYFKLNNSHAYVLADCNTSGILNKAYCIITQKEFPSHSASIAPASLYLPCSIWAMPPPWGEFTHYIICNSIIHYTCNSSKREIGFQAALITLLPCYCHFWQEHVIAIFGKNMLLPFLARTHLCHFLARTRYCHFGNLKFNTLYLY